MLSLISCQKTPAESIVQGKNDDNISSMTEDNSEKVYEEIPAHWEEKITNEKGSLNIIINADIVTNGVEDYPVLSVVNKEFTNEYVNSIMKALFGDKTLWKYDAFGVSTVTKDSIDAMIKIYADELENLELDKERSDDIKENMKWLMALYPDALDSRYQIPALTEFSDVTSANHLYYIDYEYNYSKTIYGEDKTYEEYQKIRNKILKTINEGDALEVEGIVNLGDGNEGYLNIRRNDSYGNPASIYYQIRSLDEINMETIGEVYRAPELSITENEAYEIAKELLQKLEIDYMTLLDKSKGSYYEFSFAREINGTAPNVVNNYSGNQESYTYRAQVGQESIKISINNEGLKTFEWMHPSEAVELMTDDVSMIDFNDVKEIFAKQIIINNGYSDEDDEYIENRTIYIEDIKLGSMTVAQANNSNNIIIPVWDFFGCEVVKYSDEYLDIKDRYQVNIDNERIIQEDGYSYLTISAVNGTIINRYYGY